MPLKEPFEGTLNPKPQSKPKTPRLKGAASGVRDRHRARRERAKGPIASATKIRQREHGAVRAFKEYSSLRLKASWV